MKLNYRNPLIPDFTDKVVVRKYISEILDSKYLIPLIGIYNNADEINLSSLPNKFALKTSHGCGGWNLICDDKTSINWEKEKKKLNEYMKMNGYYLSREWQYIHKPKLICEELLEFGITDYKFFCNNGKVKSIQVDIDRFHGHKRIMMSKDWEHIDINIRYKRTNSELKKPDNLIEMVKIAENLSSRFIFSRVDLYSFKNKIYFGEMTFHPGGGCEPFINYEQDLEFGKMFNFNI